MKLLANRYWTAASAAAITFMVRSHALAASFAGDPPDLPGTPAGASPSSIRNIITTILVAVLNFLALIAVVVVVIAGIRLIVSQGEEEAKEKAKKTILYALAGLAIVLFSRVIVGLVTEYLASNTGGGSSN